MARGEVSPAASAMVAAMSTFSTGWVASSRPGPVPPGSVSGSYRTTIGTRWHSSNSQFFLLKYRCSPHEIPLSLVNTIRVCDADEPRAWTMAWTWRSTSASEFISARCSLSFLSIWVCVRMGLLGLSAGRGLSQVGPFFGSVFQDARYGSRPHLAIVSNWVSPVAGTASGCGANGA